jgi:hypothetical protein
VSSLDSDGFPISGSSEADFERSTGGGKRATRSANLKSSDWYERAVQRFSISLRWSTDDAGRRIRDSGLSFEVEDFVRYAQAARRPPQRR